MAKSNMLGPASSCSSSPKTERIRFQLTSHQLDDFTRRKAKLGLDRVEGRPVLPRHLNDPIEVVSGERHSCQISWEFYFPRIISPGQVAPFFSRRIRGWAVKFGTHEAEDSLHIGTKFSRIRKTIAKPIAPPKTLATLCLAMMTPPEGEIVMPFAIQTWGS